MELLTDTGYEKLVTQIAAGEPGDVIWLSTGIGTYFEMAALGNLMDIGPLVAADKYDLKQQIQVGIDTAQDRRQQALRPALAGCTPATSACSTTSTCSRRPA